jgi:hypothetical protein
MMGKITQNSVKPDLPFACTERLYKLCLSIKKQILKRDSQIIGLFYGPAGSGKSLLAMKIGYLVSGDKLTLDKIAFNKMQFIGAVLTGRQITIQGDEGISLFHAKEAMRTEGVLMQQLIDQIRQKNLFTNILMVDILDTNKIILDRLNFACHVWESKILVKDKEGKPLRDSDGEPIYKTIKGNYALYPKLKGHDYLSPLLSYLYLKRMKRQNPLIRLPPPPPAYDRSGGTEYKPEGNHGYYPPGVPEAEYRAKKEAILEKYRKAFERKKPNTQIDYLTMDKLILAKVKYAEIAKHLNVSLATIKIRAVLLKKSHRKYKKRATNRAKATK